MNTATESMLFFQLDKGENGYAPVVFHQTTGQPLTITIPTPKAPRRSRSNLPHSWQSANDDSTTGERHQERPGSIQERPGSVHERPGSMQSYSSSMLGSPTSPASHNNTVDIQICRHLPQSEPVEFNQHDQRYGSPVNKQQGKFGGSLRKILQSFDMGGKERFCLNCLKKDL